MCGIIATTGPDCLSDALRQYEAQQSRGSEGFGFIALRQGKRVAFERATNGKSIRALMLSVADAKPDTVLFHHRYPTSTINVLNAAHPLPISKKGWAHRYWILHNGVVRGEDKREIAKDGYTPKSTVEEITYYRAGGRIYEKVEDTTVNDSEYLGYYIASFLEGQREDIPMTGSIACFVVQEHKKTGVCEVYAMRNYSNPIKIRRTTPKKGQATFMMASDIAKDSAMLEANIIWKLDQRTRTLSVHQDAKIGKDSTPSSYYSGTGYTGYNTAHNYGSKPAALKEAAPLLSAPKAADTMQLSPLSTEAVEYEREAIEKELDQALAELDAMADLIGADYEDATPETQRWLKELQDKVETLEQELDALGGPTVDDGTPTPDNLPVFEARDAIAPALA